MTHEHDIVLSGVRLNIGHFTGSVSMRQLGYHLRYLQLEEAWGTADVFSVLGCCPRLTHFSLFYGHSKETRLVNNNQLETQYPYLQCVNLGKTFDLDNLVAFAQQCPQLNSLRITWPRHGTLDVGRLLQVYPFLEYFSVGLYIQPRHDPWWARKICANTNRLVSSPMLREFAIDVCQYEAFSQALSVINMQLESLVRLRFGEFIIRGGSFNNFDMLQNQPSIHIPSSVPLEELVFITESGDVPIDLVLVPLLECCQQLRRVSIACWDIMTSHLPDRYCYALGHCLPHLHHLCLHLPQDNAHQVVNLLQAIDHHGVPLEKFEYTGPALGIECKIYEAIAAISTLRHLALNFRYCGAIDKLWMTQFLKRLRGSKSVEWIVFYHTLGFASTDAFRSLRKMSTLKRISFHYHRQMDEQGFKLLVDRKPPIHQLDFMTFSFSDERRMDDLVAYAKTRIQKVTAKCFTDQDPKDSPFIL